MLGSAVLPVHCAAFFCSWVFLLLLSSLGGDTGTAQIALRSLAAQHMAQLQSAKVHCLAKVASAFTDVVLLHSVQPEDISEMQA